MSFAHDENKVAYYNGTPDDSSIYVGYYNDLTDTHNKLNVTFDDGNLSGDSGTLYMQQNRIKGTKSASMLYHATVTVPAHTTYIVRYIYECTHKKTSSVSTETMGCRSIVAYLGEDYSVLGEINYQNHLVPATDADNTLCFDVPRNAGTKTSTYSMWDLEDGTASGIYYSNDEDNAKDFTSYFIYAIGQRNGVETNSPTNGFEGTLNISVEVKEAYINKPSSNLTTTYDGNNHWLDSFAATTDWIEEDYHLDSDLVTVGSITYKDKLDNPVSTIYDSATSAAIPDIKNAGVYTVKMELPNDTVYRWDDGSMGEESFTITINQKRSVPRPKVNPPQTTTPYESAGLPNLIPDTGSTPGTFAWNNGEVATAGTRNYGWTFTPTDQNNFTVESDVMELEFLARELSGIAVTAYNPGTNTIYTDTSLATIKSYLTVEASYTDGSTEILTSYRLEVDATDGKLVAGNNTLVISSNDDSQTITYPITGVVAKAVSAINVVQLSTSTFKYPVTAEEIKAAISRVNVQWNTGASGNLESFDDVTVSGTLNAGNAVTVTVGVSGTTATKAVIINIDKGDFDVSGITFTGDTVTYDGNNHSIACSGTLPDGVNEEYEYNGTKQATPWEFANAGTYNITLSFTHSNANYNAITTTLPATLQIDKASYTMPTDYALKKQVTYTGSAISLPANWITGLDDDVTVTYCEADGTTPFADKTAVGSYTVKAVFTVADPANYNVPETVTLTFEITDKEVYTDNLSFTVTGAEASGNNAYTATYSPDSAISIVLGGNLVDKDGAQVTPTLTYVYEKEENGAWVTVGAADLKDAGNYRVTVSVATGDATYADIDDKVITLTVEKADFDIENYVTFIGKTVAYDGNSHTLQITETGSGKPDWITVTYEVEGQDGTSFSAVGTYNFKAKFSHENENYNDIDDMPATLTISTAGVALDVTLEDLTVTYDGENHMVALTGNLPTWVTVTYYVGESEFTGAVDAGTYEVVAKFTVDESLYNKPEDMTATLKIEAAAYDMTGVTFADGAFKYDGEAHSIFVGGTALPEWITVSYTGNEVAEVGTHAVVAKFTHTNGNYLSIGDMTAEIVISRAKVALPTFKGGLSYTGVTVKPTADNFNGFDADIMTFVTDKLQSGLTVGSYKAVFALNDSENYEWATSTALKKSVFAAAIYEGETEVILNANEAAVDWNITKAVLTATRKDSALPVFASESYIGALNEVVGFKYYSDEACTEEVAAEDLARETQYYVKAELLDTDNFELDTSAAAFTVKSFTYTTPARELTLWDKIVKFLVTNWLWFVIAAAVLLFLIILICIIASAKKKKRRLEEERLAREEQRRLEEKAERERREEREEQRRREDREERMARMSQAQMPQMMMPQMVQMPQSMPQQMPQTAQSVPAGGYADNAQITRIETELAALKAAQAAKELAEIKAAQAAMHDDINELKRGDQFTGMNMDAMTEIMTRALKNVFASAAQPVVTAPPAQPAQLTDGGSSTATANAVYPPDAVMTTVTTTKIDTTKKTAQPAQAQAAPGGRTIVRNYVAPMPVDDGRVFDVGGFYKPADPVTDMDFGEDEKKDV